MRVRRSVSLWLNDLLHDPEGVQVAKGYLQYLNVLTVLKAVRDHSRLNRQVPLLPTSLVDAGPDGPWPTQKDYDGVSPGATIAFFRTNGLDKLGMPTIFISIRGLTPGQKVSAVHRLRRLQQLTLPLCASVSSSSGKPCWITEWGFTYDSETCPADDTAGSLLIREMMGDFRQLAR